MTEQKYKDLTQEFSVRRGQWIYIAKIVEYYGSGSPVLNLAKFKCLGKGQVFMGKFDIGIKFWEEFMGGKGCISKAITEFLKKAPPKQST